MTGRWPRDPARQGRVHAPLRHHVGTARKVRKHHERRTPGSCRHRYIPMSEPW